MEPEDLDDPQPSTAAAAAPDSSAAPSGIPSADAAATDSAAPIDSAPTADSAAPADATPTTDSAAPTDPDAIRPITGKRLRQRIGASSAKATLVNAWASWCGPCRREFPMLVKLRDELKKRDVELLFVSVDKPDSQVKAIEFAAEHGLEAPILVAERPLGPFKRALNPKWPGMLPATFLFDNEANLRYFWGGPVYKKEILPIVEGLLEGKAIDGEARFGLIPGKDYRQ